MRPTERGAAILAAILVVGIVATAASGMLHSQTLWLEESSAVVDAARARTAARAGIAWAAAILHQDARLTKTDHLDEPWATPLPPTRIEGTELSGRIVDVQGRYNVNNLVRGGEAQPREVARLRRLLEALGLPATLADSAVDWMDADSEPHGAGGAEDAYYLAQPGAYRTAGRPLVDLTELLRVRGYTRAVFAILAPHVSALPAPSAINVNTASAEVLLLVASGWTLAEARALAAARSRAPFVDPARFRARLPSSAGAVDMDLVRTTSEYFAVEAQVRYGGASLRAEANIHRTAPWPRVVRQSIGG